MSLAYDEYLDEHISAVQKGWQWMQDNLLDRIDPWIREQYPNTEFSPIDIFEIDDQMRYHDASKTRPEEYYPYDAYFYGGNKSHAVVENFRKAFLLHIHENPHHWQYWILTHDDPDEPETLIEIPLNYIFEMICDWWSFSWRKEDLTEIFNWWDEHKDYIRMHKKSRKVLEYILKEMKDILTEGKSEEDPEEISHSDDHLEHHGIKGQKWGVQNGPPYPLDAGAKLRAIHSLNDEMNSKWEYGVLHNGNHLVDTEDFNWGRDYRTIPIDVLKDEKIGVCWDFVNYQHDVLKNMGIEDESYMLILQKSDDPDDIVTHTFTIFNMDGKKYWMESAAWPKRGVHEITDYKDVVNELNDMYGNPGKGLSLFKYNPEGMDKGLTDKEFFDRATQNLILNMDKQNDHLAHEEKEDENKFGLPDLKKYPMPDPDHVKSAIRFFNYVDPKHEKELAEAILERMKEYDMSFEDFGVGDENRFKNYIPKADQKDSEDKKPK